MQEDDWEGEPVDCYVYESTCFDCIHCNYDNELEGDMRREMVHCERCGKENLLNG